MNKCEKCGFLHYRTDPCRKPHERHAVAPRLGMNAPDGKSPEKDAKPQSRVTEAGPVRVEMAWGQNRIVRGGGPERAPGAEIPLTKPKFDKKAWMRDYMREHRRGIRRRAAK